MSHFFLISSWVSFAYCASLFGDKVIFYEFSCDNSLAFCSVHFMPTIQRGSSGLSALTPKFSKCSPPRIQPDLLPFSDSNGNSRTYVGGSYVKKEYFAFNNLFSGFIYVDVVAYLISFSVSTDRFLVFYDFFDIPPQSFGTVTPHQTNKITCTNKTPNQFP